jgi:hypothetical protein
MTFGYYNDEIQEDDMIGHVSCMEEIINTYRIVVKGHESTRKVWCGCENRPILNGS